MVFKISGTVCDQKSNFLDFETRHSSVVSYYVYVFFLCKEFVDIFVGTWLLVFCRWVELWNPKNWCWFHLIVLELDLWLIPSEFLVILLATAQDYGVCSFELCSGIMWHDLLCFVYTCCNLVWVHNVTFPLLLYSLFKCKKNNNGGNLNHHRHHQELYE